MNQSQRTAPSPVGAGGSGVAAIGVDGRDSLQVGRLSDEVRAAIRVSYALRRVPEPSIRSLLPRPTPPMVGDIVLARVSGIGKNATLDLANGRRCVLHPGDLIAAVFGHRYATLQFEGYAAAEADDCHLLSAGGLCGLVASKHDTMPDPTRLRLEGALGDADGRLLRLRTFRLPPLPPRPGAARPRVAVVVGTSMDSGKTHTARSLVLGLRRTGIRVACIKLTGTAASRDTFTLLDAGACVALDFLDGGFPSTYRSTLPDLLGLYHLLMEHAAAEGAAWVVIEIADGIIQGETAALLGSSGFTSSVDAWLLTATDALGAAGAVHLLRDRAITPLAVSGLVSRSALGRREVEAATRIPCVTAGGLAAGELNAGLPVESPAVGRRRRSGEQSALTLG